MGQKPANILVAVDGSEPSLEAIRYVAGLFPPERAWFNLFHVMDRVPDVYWDQQIDAASGTERFAGEGWKSEQEQKLELFFAKSLQLLMRAGHKREAVTTILQERKVGIARDIALEARKGYDALVMGKRGLSSLKNLLFGSITSKIVSRVMDVPVWVVGSRPSAKKILVAVDSSAQSRRILDYVERMLTPGDGCPEVMLFHVIRGRKGFLPDYDDLNAINQKEDWVKKAIREFDRVKEEMDSLFLETEEKWERNGFPRERITGRISQGESRAGTIVDQANRGGFDTVVVGRRGITRVEEFFMGRVSNKVLQLAKGMAVWVVH